ncbi:MAG: fructosamine kinase family protein [Gammaproteobacteria bacterium]|nr:fructosamine kinase family protein [Gammaproteobacteria bacterium]
MWQAISEQIVNATGETFSIVDWQVIGGGCINSAFIVSDSGERRYFVKTNLLSKVGMFEAEFDGLVEIANSNTVRAPKPICVGATKSTAFLVMELLLVHGVRVANPNAGLARLGTALAAMHRVESGLFGWYRDNTIGSTPQINRQGKDWAAFWCEHRLGFQFQLASQQGHCASLLSRVELLLAKIDVFFQSYQPRPSLLHGDLWSGNYAIEAPNTPVIFDPAVYYGDREADIAMTELFGGFSQDFYCAYKEAYPLDDGYDVRKILYNLYHVINHLNLFGESYLGQAKRMTEQLLSEVL